ncbi:MAG: hypothetical protein ACETVZ_05370 [Phycisphaerae bacterium]
MDSTNLILTEPVLPPAPLDNLNVISLYKKTATGQTGKINEFSEEKKKQIAKDFESILLNKLLDEMKNTIGDWGFEKDGASKQVQGIFWLYLAHDIADKGGFGLWKDIYESCLSADKFLTNTEQTNKSAESLNRNV